MYIGSREQYEEMKDGILGLSWIRDAFVKTMRVFRRGPELSTIHHVAIQVDDIDKAVDWYTNILKCSIEWQDATWAMLKLKNTRIALVLTGTHSNHIAFNVKSANEYGDKVITHRDGTKCVYIHDPWGNCLEAFQE